MRNLIFLLSFLATTLGLGRDIHIGTTYGLTEFQEKVEVRNLYTTVAAFKAKCPNAYKHWRDLNVSDAVIMQQTLCTAYGIDATWTGANPSVKFIGMPVTNHNITWPAGKFGFTDTWRTSFGANKGAGDFVYYPGNSSTEFYMMKDKWLGAEDITDGGIKFKCLVVTPTWGNTTPLGYAEAWSIEGIRLVGPDRDYADSLAYTVGLGVWDMGELGHAHIRADEFAVGVLVVYGTPFLAFITTTFNCPVAGVMSMGGALNGGAFFDPFNCQPDSVRKYISADDCGAAFKVRPGFGRPGGGTWMFAYSKNETATTEEARGRWQGMPIVDAQGLFDITMVEMRAASSFVKSDAAFIVDAQSYKSKLTVIGSTIYGYSTGVFDIGNGGRYAAPAEFTANRIEWSSANGGSCKYDGVAQPKLATPCKSRLGMQRFANGAYFPAWDHQRCTPSWSAFKPTVVPPPPPPCASVWIPGTKTCSPCVGGQRTCTTPWVSNGTCEPTATKPSDVIAIEGCSVQALYTTGTKYVSTSTKTDTRVAATGGARTPSTVVLKNVKFTSTAVAYVNSNLFVGWENGKCTLWTMSPWKSTGIEVKVGVAIDQPIPMTGTTLEYVLGTNGAATATFTGTIEYY